jgi:hypothetical protein
MESERDQVREKRGRGKCFHTAILNLAAAKVEEGDGTKKGTCREESCSFRAKAVAEEHQGPQVSRARPLAELGDASGGDLAPSEV